MKFYAKKYRERHPLILFTDTIWFINDAITDLQLSRLHEDNFVAGALEHDGWGNQMLGEAIGIETLSKDELGLYLGAGGCSDAYDESPEEERLKVKTKFFIAILKKWAEEEKEFKVGSFFKRKNTFFRKRR